MANKLRINTQYIDFYLQENQISKEEFAKRCDISKKELNDVYNQKNIDIFLMVKIVDVLKITCNTFLFMEKKQLRSIAIFDLFMNKFHLLFF